MANDKTELMKKADALRRDLSELDAQISKMKTEPESVKPKIVGPYSPSFSCSSYLMHPDRYTIILEFEAPEQAEKAKAILEKMEFGGMPDLGTKCERLTNKTWYDELWNGDHYQRGQWRMGTLRKK